MPAARAYGDFLTAHLHRGFSRAAAYAFLFSYAYAIYFGQLDSFFWSWFPFSMVGLRTILIFICALVVFMLRISHMHVGLRTAVSGWEALRRRELWAAAPGIALWHMFSGWLFAQIYIICASEDANIWWITNAQNNERARLNERPIYLVAFFMLAGIVQAVLHIYWDVDRVPTPVRKILPVSQTPAVARITKHPYDQLKRNAVTILSSCGIRASITTAGAPWVYTMMIRGTAWKYTLIVAKILVSLPKSTAMPAVYPFHKQMILRCFSGSFLLFLLWEVSNAAYTAHVGQEPLKGDRPITFESRDPNGSLIIGLNGQRLQTRAFAFWELSYIAQQFQGRRKTIFEDIDRQNGSSWVQICKACMDILAGVDNRISAVLNPQAPSSRPQNTVTQPGLPRITNQALKEENVFTAPQPPQGLLDTAAQTTLTFAKTHGNTRTASPTTRLAHLVKTAETTFLTPEQREALTSQSIFARARPTLVQLLHSPFGMLFTQTIHARLNAIVLGTPYGDAGLICDAADALTRLTIHSLAEDPYGNVQRDVPRIIRQLTGTIQRLQQLQSQITPHWTDTSSSQSSPEVDTIVLALKENLLALVDKFEGYARDMRISPAELRAARQISEPPPPPKPEKETEKAVSARPKPDTVPQKPERASLAQRRSNDGDRQTNTARKDADERRTSEEARQRSKPRAREKARDEDRQPEMAEARREGRVNGGREDGGHKQNGRRESSAEKRDESRHDREGRSADDNRSRSRGESGEGRKEKEKTRSNEKQKESFNGAERRRRGGGGGTERTSER